MSTQLTRDQVEQLIRTARAKGETPDLRKACLIEADLAGVDLSGVELCKANLSGAKLRRADLRQADLHGADLGEADLREAYLDFADLCLANLDGADLSKAVLTGANLRGIKSNQATKWPADHNGHLVEEVQKDQEVKIEDPGPVGRRLAEEQIRIGRQQIQMTAQQKRVSQRTAVRSLWAGIFIGVLGLMGVLLGSWSAWTNDDAFKLEATRSAVENDRMQVAALQEYYNQTTQLLDAGHVREGRRRRNT